jgi:hypothetical protein
MATKIMMWVLFMIAAFSIMLAVYGSILFYSRTDRLDFVEALRVETANCRLKVRELRRNDSLAPVLEQLLTPCQIDELEAGAEVIRQKRNKNSERHEMSLLDEKERKK